MRALAVAAIGAFFGPWVAYDWFFVGAEPVSGWTLYHQMGAAVAGAGLSVPLEALRSGRAADAEREGFFALWTLWGASLALVAVLPRRLVRVRFAAAVAVVGTFTLFNMDGDCSGRDGELPPAFLVIGFVLAAIPVWIAVSSLDEVRRARIGGLCFALAALPASVVLGAASFSGTPHWGWWVDIVFSSAILVIASLDLRALEMRDE